MLSQPSAIDAEALEPTAGSVNPLLQMSWSLVLWVLAFKVALDFSYFYSISPLFDYTGLTTAVEPIKYLEGWVATMLFACLIKGRVETPSDFFFLIFGLLTVIPVASLYGLRGDARWAFYAVMLASLTLWAAINTTHFKRDLIPKPDGLDVAVRIALALTLLDFGWLIVSGGLSNINFDFDAVYDLREEAEAAQDVGIFGYLNFWVPNVMLPFLLARSLHNSQRYQAALYIALEVMLFAMTTHKRVLFYPVLVLLLYRVATNGFNARNFVRLFTALIAVLVGLLAISEDYLMPISLFVRRALFVPADLVFGYLDVFSRLGHVWMSNTFFGSFINYPFDEAPPLLVGSLWLGSDATWANAGFLATGYMHFGVLGAIAFSAIIGVILRYIDALSTDVPLWFALSIVAGPMTSVLSSADLPTSLLTHGIAISLVILWLVARSASAELAQAGEPE